MSSRLVSAAVAAGALALAAAACGGSTTHHASTNSLAAQWHRVVLCARAHGMPNAPDPQIDSSGQAHFPPSLHIPAETRSACQSMADRLTHQPVSSADYQKLIQFARCVRTHGIADWPDPDPDGAFPIGSQVEALGKRVIAQDTQLCARQTRVPFGGIRYAG